MARLSNLTIHNNIALKARTKQFRHKIYRNLLIVEFARKILVIFFELCGNIKSVKIILL